MTILQKKNFKGLRYAHTKISLVTVPGSHHTPLVAASLISPIARGSGAARALAMGVKLAMEWRTGRLGPLSKNQN